MQKVNGEKFEASSFFVFTILGNSSRFICNIEARKFLRMSSQFCLQNIWTYVSLHIVGLLNDSRVSIPGRSGDVCLLHTVHAALRPN